MLDKNKYIKFGENFQKIISNCSEARIYMIGSWWNVCEFELDCSLVRIDVMDRFECYHISDFDKIEIDGIEYNMDDILN